MRMDEPGAADADHPLGAARAQLLRGDMNLAQGNPDIGTIESVEMLGSDQDLEWNQAWVEGFRVKMPDEKPCDFAYTLKIKRTGF